MLKKDYSKCAFIDAWMLPNSIRNGSETKDVFKNFSENVFISYIDENGVNQIEEFKPVYEYYTPVQNYYSKKEVYQQLFKENPNWVEEVNAKIENEADKIYVGIDKVICRKHTCETYKDFDNETHNFRDISKLKPREDKFKGKKEQEAPSEYGSSVKIGMTILDIINRERKEQGLYPYKQKYFTYEASHNVVFKTLIRNFSASDKEVVMKLPELKCCFFDIEVDVRMDEEFPNPWSAILPINAISMYNVWEGRNITLALCPSRPYEGIQPLTIEEARKQVEHLPDTYVFEREEDLLEAMISNFEKCDCIMGYNSENFDLPFIVNRVRNVLGKDAVKRLNRIKIEPLVIQKQTRTGQKYKTYQLIGRIHIDYLVLYKHHTPKQQPSYKLDFIGKMETGEGKEEYEGNLEQLYHRDFKKFVEYNRQDAALLKKIDDKKKFVHLTNSLAHTHGVTMDAMIGTVAWVDQWQINNAHMLGKVCPDKYTSKEEYEKKQFKQMRIAEYNAKKIEFHPESPYSPDYDWNDYGAPGAWVNMPMRGVAFNMASYDINSLYPSIMRSINVGIEAIVGRIRQNYTAEYMKNKCITKKMYEKVAKLIPDYTKLWEHEWAVQEMKMIWGKTDDLITVDFEDGKVETRTAAEWNDIIFNKMGGEWCISANGTIFDTTTQAVTAYTMEKGYAERKGFQKIMRQYESCHDSVGISKELEAELSEFLEE